MLLENRPVITTFDVGSKYQKTSDLYSDNDYVQLIFQPLNDTIFLPLDKGTQHYQAENGDDYRVYSLEKFMSMMMKHSYGSYLMLCALLEQDAETGKIFKELYDSEHFTNYVRSHLNYSLKSFLGLAIEDSKRSSKDNATGKLYFNFVLSLNHLEYLVKFAKDPSMKLIYDTFARPKEGLTTDVKEFLAFKRLKTEEEMAVFREAKSELLNKYFNLLEELRNEVNALTSKEKNVKPLMDYETIFKNRATKLIVAQYMEELSNG